MTAGAGGATAAAHSRSRRWTLLLQGLACTLVCLWAGEWLARVAPLGLTGSVAGMLLLLVSLQWAALREPVAAAATVLLGHLSFLFIPISVGLMIHGELLSRYGGRLLIAVALSTWIGMAITALVMQRLMSGPAASVLSSSRSTTRGD
jgi:holin-like protein